MVAVPQLPALVGQAWPVTRTTLWSATKETAFNGASVAFSNWSYPRYKWTLSYNYLGSGNINGQTNTDWQTLAGFYDRMQGSANLFQYSDPDDCQVATQQNFGLGDGVTSGYQLNRTISYATSPVFAPRINLLYEDICNINYWTPTYSTITAANISDPLGGFNAIKLNETIDNQEHYIAAIVPSVASNIDLTHSFYVKAAERSWVILDVAGKGDVTHRCYFNATTGLFGVVDSIFKNVFAIPLSNGWYRLGATFNSLSGAGTPSVYIVVTNANNSSAYVGTITNGIYLFGPVLEVGYQLPATTADGSYASPFPLNPVIEVHDWHTSSIEEHYISLPTARTNLLSRSVDFTDGNWTKTRASITATSFTGPDGATVSTGVLKEDATATNSHYVSRNVTGLTANTLYTWSVYLFEGNATNGRTCASLIAVNADSTTYKSYFDLHNNLGPYNFNTTLRSNLASGVGSWRRCQITFSTGSGTTANIYIGLSTGVLVLSDVYTGDNVSFIYVWGAQLEKGCRATLYIPTVATAVTVTDITLDNYGFVTFATVPPSGNGITWSGSYNWYCRFDDDNVDFTNLLNNIWSAPKLTFTSVKFGTAV